MGQLTLKIATPKGTRDPVMCDSIRLTICDDLSGRGGGSYGIRPGHAKALFSLDKGSIRAFLSGRNVLTGESGVGFVTVDQNTVTVVTEDFSETNMTPGSPGT